MKAISCEHQQPCVWCTAISQSRSPLSGTRNRAVRGDDNIITLYGLDVIAS